MGDMQFDGTQEEWDALVKKNKSKSMTAVEWLHENNKVITQTLLDNKVNQGIIDQLLNCFVINLEQAKEMEKQQIIDAHLTGLITSLETEATKQATEYYNDTYGSGVLKEGSGAVGEIGGAVASPQTEISDEEIYKEAEKYYKGLALTRFVQGAKWYREQLKLKKYIQIKTKNKIK